MAARLGAFAIVAITLAVGAHARGGATAAVAVVSVSSPSDLAGNFAGLFAPGSPTPASPVELVAFVPPGDAEGCAPYPAPPRSAGDFVAVVGLQNCSVVQKALMAEAAGASGIMIVSATEEAHTEELPAENATLGAAFLVVSVPRSLGEAIATRSMAGGGATPDRLVRMSVEVYDPPGLLDASLLLMACLATSLVVAGAFFATADLRLGSPIAPKAGEVVEMGRCFPLAFCCVGSTVLVVLYFLMQYLIYVIIFTFCLGGTTQLTELLGKSLRYRFTALQHRLFTAPLLGPIEVAHLIAFPCALSIAASWLLLRNTDHGWIFQDIIGASFLCFIQRTIRLPSMKLAAVFLVVMFVFDIFWVFLSPVFFERSVMVVVATGGGTGEFVPMLLRIPAIADPLGRERMLGFGDIALPGMLISFLRRHDLLSRRRSFCGGYFAPAVAGYFAGMCAAFAALHLMKTGQPALLYLVPSTLGPTLVLACLRRELGALWQGEPCRSAGDAKAAGSLCGHCPSGHALQLTAAEAGRCDGCAAPVPQGAPVMDCRQCNWYLCGACRPVAGSSQGMAAEDVERGSPEPSAGTGVADVPAAVDNEDAAKAREAEQDLGEGSQPHPEAVKV